MFRHTNMHNSEFILAEATEQNQVKGVTLWALVLPG